ncbi:MAG: ferredoxin reductase [Candidatus Eremiobacteraeota bacterium]|nr:ferredoxin reductase [Candidatus Eremiobacteraeota bacterium]
MAVLEWQVSTVKDIRVETPSTKTFTLALPRWMEHKPGQHYDLRLTGPDGYQTERSYSVASAPERTGVIELTVERIADGEVSPYLHDVVVAGDQLEVRGPVGGYFVWDAGLGGPLLLIAGGSGVVPLMAMLRHRAAHNCAFPTCMLYSSRTADDVIYRSELDEYARNDRTLDVAYTFTRQAPPGWTGFDRRIDAAMLHDVIAPLGSGIRAYVCGPTLLVESVANTLVGMGLLAQQVRTERFGPTGK